MGIITNKKLIYKTIAGEAIVIIVDQGENKKND